MNTPEPPPSASAADDVPHYPGRLDEVADSLEALHRALGSQETLDTILRRLAETTVQAFPDADVVTVTVMREGQLHALAATDSRAAPLDQQQADSVAGPYQDAIQHHRPVRVGLDEHTRHRWPEFSHTANTAGVAASLSAPLFTDTGHHTTNSSGVHTDTGDQHAQLLGLLNIYGDTPDAFDPFDEALLRLLSTTASAAVTSAHRHARTRELVDQLQHALESRPEIDQAKGALMAIHSTDADTAFNMLVTQSQHSHTKLHTVVRALLDSL